MRLWVGHYIDNPKEWFLVWAHSRDEAFRYVDSTVAEPDLRSLQPVRDIGLVNFRAEATAEGGEDEYVHLTAQEEVWLEDMEIQDWILARVKKPLSRAVAGELPVPEDEHEDVLTEDVRHLAVSLAEFTCPRREQAPESEDDEEDDPKCCAPCLTDAAACVRAARDGHKSGGPPAPAATELDPPRTWLLRPALEVLSDPQELPRLAYLLAREYLCPRHDVCEACFGHASVFLHHARNRHLGIEP